MLGMLDYSYQTFTGELTGFTHELSYGTTVSGVDLGVTLVETLMILQVMQLNQRHNIRKLYLGYSF